MTEVASDQNLKAARRSRGGHRAYATKVVKETETMLMEISNDAAKAAEKLADLKTNGSLLEQKLEELCLWDKKVANLIEKDEDFDQKFIDSGNYNRTIVKVLVGNKDVVTLKVKPETKPEITEEKKVSTPTLQSSKSSSKLPWLDFPSFDGNPLKFLSFWDTFECIIDKDDNLDDQMKFTYLKNKMEGTAKLALEGLTLTKANYAEA